MDLKTPLVSVIMATYNRSNILKYSIGSLLEQTYKNFELIVVDDASTDDTVEVVASFKDRRIQLIKLEHNHGGQSDPNNTGLKFAKGQYIAYLNQDDLFFPDHLEKMLETIETSKADWVYSYFLTISGETLISIRGIFPNDEFKSYYGTGFSGTTWLVRREILDELGGWRSAFSLRIPPSQDLIFRGIKENKKILPCRAVTVIQIYSSHDKNSYSERHFALQKYYYEQMLSNRNLREELCLKAYVIYRNQLLQDSISFRMAIRGFFVTCLNKISKSTGIPSLKIYQFFMYPGKGKYIKAINKHRGLNNIPN
ncbi:MAG: glycosyltransferase family 2 protein [Bacteroidia bacterium]|nr:glycosyltransferase family 2 protein [Bacteroidia bacterium]